MAFSISNVMLHINILSRIDGTRGSEREFVSDLDTMHLSTDCSLSERDDKIAQA
jgi:hypothetical protein